MLSAKFYFVLILLSSLAWARPDEAIPAESPTGIQHIVSHGIAYDIFTVDPKTDGLQLFWKDDDGKLLRDFDGLEKYVGAKGGKLLFAANAGMFDPQNKPVGLLVQSGNETCPLNLNDGTGNFFMKPNGVFLINEKHEAMVVASSDFAGLLTPVVWATQSGPMLVHGGAIHPDFVSDSKNVAVRSGVGVRKDGTIVFAISHLQVNLYTFASLFLNRLKCSNALYLDGTISAFHAPGMKDTVPHFYGPMIGIVAPAKNP